MFQEAALFPWLSVWNNVIFGPKVNNIPRHEYEHRANQMLRMVGLEDFRDHLPVQLSGGMRQRVGIARILTLGSNILLMDEPFGALDEITRHKLDEELLTLWEKNKFTVLFVTHSIHEAVFLSTRIIMMAARPGRVTEQFLVPEPYPRGSEFLVSSSFMQCAQRVQASLLKASV